MLCALTVRTLKPGTFDQFREAFLSRMPAGKPPAGWVRFNMIRSGDEVVCFGFFDGTRAEMQSWAQDYDYEGQQRAIAPFVESVGADSVFEIVEDLTP